VGSTYYEIRLSAMPPGDALAGLGLRTAGMPTEVCVLGSVPGQSALSALIARLEELGIEVDEIRRVGGHRPGWNQPGDRR
jgi:hypothetical protein